MRWVALYTNAPMNGMILEKQVAVRVAEPVYKHLRKLAEQEDLKVSDLVRKAIRRTYGLPKKVS